VRVIRTAECSICSGGLSGELLVLPLPGQEFVDAIWPGVRAIARARQRAKPVDNLQDCDICTAEKKRYSITSSAAGSPEKQKINDDEGCDYGTGAEGEHVANIVSGHALACLDCSFDDPFVVPFRHQGLFFAAPTGAFPGINAIAVRSFLRVRLRYATLAKRPTLN
jgi:hypothetical protein